MPDKANGVQRPFKLLGIFILKIIVMKIILFTCGCTGIDAYHFALGSIYEDLSKSILKTTFYFIFEGFSYEVTLDKYKFDKAEITYTIRKK